MAELSTNSRKRFVLCKCLKRMILCPIIYKCVYLNIMKKCDKKHEALCPTYSHYC